MIYSHYRISLDIHNTAPQAMIFFNKDDSAREITFVLTEDGKPYKLTEDCSCVLSAVKPDGTELLRDCSINAETGEILYDIGDQTATAVGTFTAQLTVMGGDDVVISTPVISFCVRDVVIRQIDLDSIDDFSALVIAYNSFNQVILRDFQDVQNRVANMDEVVEAFNDGELKGDTGDTGNGIASISKTSTSGNVDTYTITFTNGNHATFTVTNADPAVLNAKLDKQDKPTPGLEYVYINGNSGNGLKDLSVNVSDEPTGKRAWSIPQRDANGKLHAHHPTDSDNEFTVATKGYVDSHSGGGEGTVKSVNGVEPDEEGNVALQASNIGAAPVVGGKIPASYIPGSYDDVIEGYYYNLKFYEEASHTTEITGERGKLYVDIPSNKSYRYTGSGYTAISDFDPSTIITQGTGSAQDKVMSQKAVTDALSEKQNTLQAGANITINGTTISASVPAAPVTSVNGQTGAVVLKANNIDNASTGNDLATDIAELQSAVENIPTFTFHDEV